MLEVILVCGPPCAGKSTYVAEHAQPGDVVLDQDVLGTQGMEEGLAAVRAMTEGRAWVIRCAPGVEYRRGLAQELRATRTVLLRPDNKELYRRAQGRPKPGGTWQAIRKWLHAESGHVEQTPAGPVDPAPHRRAAW